MVRYMQEHFNSRPEELVAAIGPSICVDCYEVSEEVAEQFREEIEQLKNKYIVVRERRSSLRERLGFYKRSMLKSHPSITSRKFADALQELKEIAQEKRKKK